MRSAGISRPSQPARSRAPVCTLLSNTAAQFPRERTHAAETTGTRTPTKWQPQAGPYLLLGGAQLAVGAAAIFARFALTGAGPIAVAASRLCIAALVLLAIASLRRDASARPTRRQAVLLGAAGIALAAHFGWWIASLDDTSVAVSTLLVATTPVWTAAYDAVAHRRAPSRRTLAAFVIGAIGLTCVVGFGAYENPAHAKPLLGALLALGGALAMAAYLLIVREARGALPTRAIVTRTYAWAAAVLILAAALAHQPPPPLSAAGAWGGILGMALVSQLLGHTAINAALRWFSPSAVAFSTLMEPVSAAILALVVFGEPLPPAVVAGGAVLLAALGLVLSDERLRA